MHVNVNVNKKKKSAYRVSRTHMTMLPKKGFCYAAINKSMPGLVKIGCTERSPYLRVRQLFTTSVPEPFVLMAYISCEAPRHMEAKIHKHFETVSVSPNREFFRVSEEKVVAYFAQICRDYHNTRLHISHALATQRLTKAKVGT